jgi:DedD protein
MTKVSSMDRRLKERLIGATILVALIVLIVPELLTGPRRPAAPPLSVGPPAASRSVSIDLATSRATSAPQTRDAASASAVEPSGVAPRDLTAAPADSSTPAAATPDTVSPGVAAPSVTAPGRTTNAAPTVTTLRAQEEATGTLESPPSSPRSWSRITRSGAVGEVHSGGAQPHHAWAVQLGSFVSKANAEKLVQQLKAKGSSVYVMSSGSGSSLRYRVRMGPMADREAAERIAVKLKAEGHAATIVNPAS